MAALAGPVAAKPTKLKIKTQKAVKIFTWHRVLNNDPKYDEEENLWKKTKDL
jgi:alkylated DNA nucleotide flippase Atl1